ncbi:hypothetical protein EJ377_02010 [Chryseobacterium arthrosphaerae]|uniref:Uncharacterized protein n=1 Tax=Chryseobacterium arthrosphaerae TaxID=651561 RepID=A0A432DYT5_9FLAO|nr:hypothetical protein EJ377_02010 [Chryseobacterium arthrosphaerae]
MSAKQRSKLSLCLQVSGWGIRSEIKVIAYRYCITKIYKVNQDHIIQKVFVEITVNNKEKALDIKEDINSFCLLMFFRK